MSSWYNLILNENMKIYRRLRTWAAVFVTVLLILALGAFYHNHFTTLPSQADQWNFLNNIVPVLGELEAVIAAIVAGDIVASEFSWGTIKALLTRPVRRWQILFAKFLAAILFGVLVSAVALLSAYVMGGTLYGFSGAGLTHTYLNGHHHMSTISAAAFTLMYYGLTAGMQVLMTITIAFTISSILRSSSVAIALSIVTVFAGSTAAHFLQGYSWGKYILFANTDLSQYFINGPSMKGMTVGFSTIVLLVYCLVMSGLSYFVFERRDVSTE